MSEVNDKNNIAKKNESDEKGMEEGVGEDGQRSSMRSLGLERSTVRLPWGATRERLNLFSNMLLHSTVSLNSTNNSSQSSSPSNELIPGEKKKPGEYVMHLLMLNFIQTTAKKFEQIINGEKRVREKNLFYTNFPPKRKNFHKEVFF